MIYPEPKLSAGGDQFILAEFGNEMTLSLNFLVRSFNDYLKQSHIPGVIETVPSIASCMIHYDPKQIQFNALKKKIQQCFYSLGNSPSTSISSRLFYIPILYFDPWSKACIEDYDKTINPKTIQDPDYIVQLNQLENREHFIHVHSRTEYWVAGLGFWPGFPLLIPLDARSSLFAPKYNPPRLWTPKGTVGIGGGVTSIYPATVPGGYQIFAHVPTPIWDLQRTLKQFTKEICLFKPGDRVKFVPQSLDAIKTIQAEIDAGTYCYSFKEQTISYQTLLEAAN